MQFDLNNFLDDLLFGEAADKRDYRKFPECRPWPVLLFEMVKEKPKYIEALPAQIRSAIARAIEVPTSAIAGRVRLTRWQRFNGSLQFDIGEQFIWFRLNRHQEKNGSIMTEEIVKMFIEDGKK